MMATTQQFGHTQTLEWARRMGGNLNDQAVSVVTDAAGNVYTTGYFQNTVDFDPGSGTFNLTSSGGYDIFISKLNAAGNFVWAKQMGGTFNDEGMAITVDDSGNVFTTGYFQSTADFDPDTGTFNLVSSGSYDIFVSKLNASGSFVWAKRMGGNGVDIGNSIHLDLDGNVYTTGSFRNTADFDPGTATYSLTSAGFTDIFISKLDANGDFLWAQSTGESSFDSGIHITTDADGNVYTTGNFQDTVDFDFGSGVSFLISNGVFDVYIAKYTSSGSLIWAKSIGGLSSDQSTSMAVDSAGNVYTTGYFSGTVDFNPGFGLFTLTSAGIRDAFVSKLDDAGNFVWAKRIGGPGDDRGYAMTLDAENDIYITGVFEDSADFDPSPATFNLSSAGGNDIFITKLNSDGNLIWARRMGGVDDDAGQSIATDPSNNVFTTGVFRGTADFDPGPGTENLISAGQNDAFVHKMSQCPAAYSTHLVEICDSLTWIDGNTYTSSNNSATYTFLGGAANGCDSLVTLDLTILNAANGTDVQTACDSLTWIDGNTYTTSNNSATYTFIGGAANGCDSLVTLDLTILNDANGTDVQTACDSLTWIDGNTYTTSNNSATYTFLGGAVNGCDSLVTLDLTILNAANGIDVQTACNGFTWIDGNTYTTNNDSATYTFIGGATNGCDSIVSLSLTINSVSDLTVAISGFTLKANNSEATYQWLNCTGNSILFGETGQIFTTMESGDYAVELTENGCVDTSDCVTIAKIGIIENSFSDELMVYPNPTKGNIAIDLGEVEEFVRLRIINLHGKTIQSHDFYDSQYLTLEIDGAGGVYLVVIESLESAAIFKVIKE